MFNVSRNHYVNIYDEQELLPRINQTISIKNRKLQILCGSTTT